MSDPLNQPHQEGAHDAPHEGPIRTPKQLILAVLYSFVVPIGVIVLLVMYVTAQHRPAAGSTGLGAEAVGRRLAPVGVVEVKDASDLSTLKSGEQVFAGQCTSCHTAGLLGAPKFGDAEAWAPRIKTGYDTLLNSALHGKNQMPAQGGGDYSDLEIARAVVYMANKGGAHFDEPKLPAAADAAASEPAATVATQAPVAAPAAMPAAPAAMPAAPVVVAAAEPAKAEAVPALFTQVCQVCHASGLAGAPKLGDKAAWAPRVAQGIDGLTASAIKGKGAMPPKGGSNASEAEIKTVVTYMVNAVK